MDTLLPTGFILGVLPIAWLSMQLMCWWGLSRLMPQGVLSNQQTALLSVQKQSAAAPAHRSNIKSS